MSLTENSTNRNLITWNGISMEKAKMEEFCRNNKKISWYISHQCNFQCDYCGEWTYARHAVKPIDINKLSESLNYLQKDWIFYITGGEPFLEKNFVEICQEITKKHYLSFSTNLSTANVFDFADKIDPKKCLFINASVHPTQREKTDKNFNSYIEKMLYLQKKGFNIISVYVAHPILFDRIKSDFARFKLNGIEKVHVKIFQGNINGNNYPASLNPEQKKILESMEADYPEFEVMNNPPDFYGHLCIAGQKSFAMDREGNLKRCSSVLKNHGNFFEKSIKFDAKAMPCPKHKYVCVHECIEFHLITKGNNISLLKENIIETSLRMINGDIITKKSVIKGFWQLIGAIEKAGIPLDKIKKLFIKSK